MPITRTAMIDDDGSGTTGTILNNAWKQELYNQIDAYTPQLTILRYGQWAEQTLSAAAYDNFRPLNGATSVAWLLTATVATALTGIQAEPDQTQHLLINDGNAAITFHNNHTSSSVGNRIYVPGFATTYTLGVWSAIWAIYLSKHNGWLLLKAT